MGGTADFYLVDMVDDYSYHVKENPHARFFYFFRKSRKGFPHIFKPIVGFAVFAWFLGHALKHNYDVFVPIVEYYPSFITSLVAKIVGKKSITIIVDHTLRDLSLKSFSRRSVDRLFLTLSLWLSTHTVCISRGLLSMVRSVFKVDAHKSLVIYDGVPPLNTQPVEPQHKIPHIIAVGRLVAKKNHALLLRAVENIPPSLCFRLTIVGKGSEYNALRQQIRAMKNSSRVALRGFKSGSIYTLLKRADVSVFTSSYEGFGNTIIEAMQCGVPVVSTNCEFGPQEIINDTHLYTNSGAPGIVYGKYGILINTTGTMETDAHTLSLALIRILKEKRLRYTYRRLSYKRAAYFTDIRMGRQYYELFQRLIAA